MREAFGTNAHSTTLTHADKGNVGDLIARAMQRAGAQEHAAFKGHNQGDNGPGSN